MTPSDYYIPSTADYDSYYISSPDPPSHPFSNRIMVIAIVILFIVIFFISSLHIFSKWAWRSQNRPNSGRRDLFLNRNLETHRSGLSKDVIAQLPTFTYKMPVSNDLEAGKNPGVLECAVCLSEFQEDEKGRLLPSCKHSFHIECIDMWFYSHSTCPLCRAMVVPTISNPPLTPITISIHEHQREAEHLALQGAQNAIEATSFADESNQPLNAMATPTSDNVANPLQIPTNTLFCGDSIQSTPAQVASSQSLEQPLQLSSSSSSSRSTRSVPHITIEIPTRQDINLTSPVCNSLSSWSPQCASPHEAAYPSVKSLKSPGLRESVKKMLSMHSSKEKRAFSNSSQEGNMKSPRACT